MNLSEWQKKLASDIEAGKAFVYSIGCARGKAKSWQKLIKAAHKSEPKKPEINLITFDECAEFTDLLIKIEELE